MNVFFTADLHLGHDNNAKHMLRYYKGELELKKPEAKGGGKRLA